MARSYAATLIATFQEHYEELVRFLVRQTGDAERAADLAQDTYLRLAAAGSPGPAIDNPRAYVYRIAGNLAIDLARRDGRHAARFSGSRVDEAVLDPAPSPEAALWSKERLRALDDALGELPPKMRSALLLFRVDGLSHAEIARRLAVSESMVAKYIAQALRHCRDRLDHLDRT